MNENENEIKPVAWCTPDSLNAAKFGGLAVIAPSNKHGCSEPLYDQSTIDRLTAERDVALGKLAAAYAETDAHWKVLLKAKGELAEARAERDAAAEAFTRLFVERQS